MSKGRYSQIKMTNYFLISALFFLSGFWKLFLIKTQEHLPADLVITRGEDVLISISAFLFFALIFLVMGLRHAIWHYQENHNHHAAG